ncbi:lipopolysaccharide export system permease protein [Ectothiorhodosinus mongolicus]|uniref:Lipopolysaccharide export system permease protein n=1 Tax=Ectothiorhodosinus mongolicus TaxID=233100 RepID=A0A1R3W4C7_9GAMM|nr:LPS export ABC transporter permease LptG [Ectothiorhodosinus mongolicus]ULX57516.1 LPS export ABC transporter permease LptG [Ectothiorhodosinus mongolicus]SIT72587.1 lipopolysaccharide export system permease protein [Ectothiorhodosinus mongolicus]
MSILNRYLTMQIIGGALLALLVLLALDVAATLINEMEQMSETYGWLQVLTYTLLTIPGRLYLLFPPAVLIGALLSLGAVAENSELTAMRSAGLSIGQISRNTLTAGMILMLIAVFLGEVVAPASERQAQQLRTFGVAGQVHLGGTGLWARDEQKYIHVRRILPDLHLRDVRVYTFDRQQLVESVQIRDAFNRGASGWEMQGLVRSSISTTGVLTARVDQEIWPRLLAPELFDVIVVEPSQMSGLALWRYISYLRVNQLESSVYELALWGRIATPMSSLVMLLLALPFIFGPLRAGGTGQRLFVGMLLGIGFHLVNQTLAHGGLIWGLPPALSATLPMLIFLAFALWGLSRVR